MVLMWAWFAVAVGVVILEVLFGFRLGKVGVRDQLEGRTRLA